MSIEFEASPKIGITLEICHLDKLLKDFWLLVTPWIRIGHIV